MPYWSVVRGDGCGYVAERVRPEPRCLDWLAQPDADRVVEYAVEGDLYLDGGSAGEHEHACRLEVGRAGWPVERVAFKVVLADGVIDDHVAVQVLVQPRRE